MIVFYFILVLVLILFNGISASSKSRKASKSKSKTTLAARVSSRAKVISSSSGSSHFEINESTKLQAKKLNENVKKFARKQLGLPEDTPNRFNYTEYDIKNWPEFVPTSFRIWDSVSISEISAALPSLKFIRKSCILSPNQATMESRKLNRRKIQTLLLDEFNVQTGKASKTITWASCHLLSWPVGVRLQTDHWNFAETLAVYRSLKKIKFIPVDFSKEKRTITFTNGTHSNLKKIVSTIPMIASEDCEEQEMESFENEYYKNYLKNIPLNLLENFSPLIDFPFAQDVSLEVSE